MKQINKQQVEATQAMYNKITLTIYDFLALLISSHLVWECPSSKIVKFYNQFVSNNHLDIGVGTGFF